MGLKAQRFLPLEESFSNGCFSCRVFPQPRVESCQSDYDGKHLFSVTLARNPILIPKGVCFRMKNPDGKAAVRKVIDSGLFVMLVGYMRISTTDDRQSVDRQRDALIAAGVDVRWILRCRLAHQFLCKAAKVDIIAQMDHWNSR